MRLEPQNFRTIESSELTAEAQKYAGAGYRFIQAFAVTTDGGCDVTYSFEKDMAVENIQFSVPAGGGFASVSPLFGAAFAVENEMHDLFGLDITGITIDFAGKFYTLATPSPMTVDTSAFEVRGEE